MNLAQDTNDIYIKNVYPFADDDSIASENSSGPERDPAPIERAIAIGQQAHPAPWWLALAVLLIALMWTARKFDGGGNYGNLKLSAYNIFTVTLASIIGISLMKLAVQKFPVPGLTTVVLAV